MQMVFVALFWLVFHHILRIVTPSRLDCDVPAIHRWWQVMNAVSDCIRRRLSYL